METVAPQNAVQAAKAASLLKQQIQRVIKGKDEVIDKVLIALLAGGHVLVEDLQSWEKPLWPIAWLNRSTADSREFNLPRIYCLPMYSG